MAANGIQIHARPQPVTYTEIEVSAIRKHRTALDHSATAALA